MLREEVEQARGELGAMERGVRRFLDNGYFTNEQDFRNQHGEMRACIMLAVRHIEDARMRLGKVLQQMDGGVSIYDK